MARRPDTKHRLERSLVPTVRSWEKPTPPAVQDMDDNAVLHCGWGRLIFGHTFDDPKELARTIMAEKPGQRDIAFYLRDPHVILSMAPDQLFLDPSHTYRIWFDGYHQGRTKPEGFVIRRARSTEDGDAINAIYDKWKMVLTSPALVREKRNSRTIAYFVAEDTSSGQIVGSVMGVDHKHAFSDPENGSSFWCLAVDPQAPFPRVGEALVRHAVEYFMARGRSYLDLSVMHDNEQAIALYEKLGFKRAPVFAVKHKNPINEPLFTGPAIQNDFNPYAGIIVKEARRRGIVVDVVDEPSGHFALTFGGRTVVCWESLTEMTSAIAMVRCDDKSMTRRLLDSAGLNVPDQRVAGSDADNAAFMQKHGSIVVKPKRGEQGMGIAVDVRTYEELHSAVQCAAQEDPEVLLEEYVHGEDLRIIVIDNKYVAAAVRRPARITGTGQHSIRELIEKQSRRRAAATGGESTIPLDAETERCLKTLDCDLDTIPDKGCTLAVRKTANLHTGGTIHDVTEDIHPDLVRAAERASVVLDIPVVGLDFIVPDLSKPEYVIIEANERPGLANHEPAPTAQRFIDFLFPQTITGDSR